MISVTEPLEPASLLVSGVPEQENKQWEVCFRVDSTVACWCAYLVCVQCRDGGTRKELCQGSSHLDTQAPEEQGCVVMVAVTLRLDSFPSEASARFVFGKKTNDALGRSAVKFNDWL